MSRFAAHSDFCKRLSLLYSPTYSDAERVQEKSMAMAFLINIVQSVLRRNAAKA